MTVGSEDGIWEGHEANSYAVDQWQHRSWDDALHISSEGRTRSTHRSLCLCARPNSLCDDAFGGAFQVILVVMRTELWHGICRQTHYVSTCAETFNTYYLVINIQCPGLNMAWRRHPRGRGMGETWWGQRRRLFQDVLPGKFTHRYHELSSWPKLECIQQLRVMPHCHKCTLKLNSIVS